MTTCTLGGDHVPHPRLPDGYDIARDLVDRVRLVCDTGGRPTEFSRGTNAVLAAELQELLAGRIPHPAPVIVDVSKEHRHHSRPLI